MFSLKKMVLASGLLLGAVFATNSGEADAGHFRHYGGGCYRPPVCRPVYRCYDPCYDPCYRPVYRPICRPVYVPSCHSYPWGY